MSSFIRPKNFYLFLTILIGFFALHSVVSAQAPARRINISPESPGPFQSVTISVEDFSGDIDATKITWTVNGKAATEGTGRKSYTVRTGALGTKTDVSINIGGSVENVSLRPAVVDLHWQADTYTPPFYQGKAQHSNQDTVTVVAEPFFLTSAGARINPDALVYRWKVDGRVNQNASGYGKKSFQVASSVLPKPLTVDVDVYSADETYRGQATIVIPESTPEVLLYENDPLYGISFSKALNGGEHTISNTEVTVLGIPFFFSNSQRNTGSLTKIWKLNGNTINESGDEIILKKPSGDVSGRSQISFEVKNPVRFMQNAKGDFYVRFNNENSSNSTGFF